MSEPSTQRLRASKPEHDDEPATQLLRPAQERVGHPPVDPGPEDGMAGPAVTEPAETEPADDAWYDTTSDDDSPQWLEGSDGEQIVETVPVERQAVEHPTVEIPIVAVPAVEQPAAPGPVATRISPGPIGPAAVPRPRVDSSTAAELTEDAIVRFRGDRPRHGWRGAVFTATGGLVNPGIGESERHRQEQLRRIRRPLPGSHQIAVSSIKGGVGKTTVSACLGLVLAEYRGDRVIALDANPDAGTLADRLTAETSSTVRNLLRNIDLAQSLTEVARFTSFAGRLQVLASEQDPAMSEAFSREEYEQVCAVLTRFYNIVITDSGTGLVHSAMEGTLALAQSLVVVGSPTVDGASRASKTLDWLIAHGYSAQVADAVVVLSCDRTSKDVDRGRVREHFEARCRAVVEVPHDPHLATGGRIALAELRPATHDAFVALAALLAEAFGAPAATRTAPPAHIPGLG